MIKVGLGLWLGLGLGLVLQSNDIRRNIRWRTSSERFSLEKNFPCE